MFLAVVVLVTAVAILKGVAASDSNATSPQLNELNATTHQVTLTTTSETPLPVLVTTVSPEVLAAIPKRRLGSQYRRAKQQRSTSSSSSVNRKGKKKRKGRTDERGLSLDLSSLSDIPSKSSPDGVTKKGEVKSSADRRGWRKWHRKCNGCPDLKMKWREPKVTWICGAYQRARRSFKSECVMHFRNCQDGTMFVKVAAGKCADDQPGEPLPHGEHFFYDYAVQVSGESTKSSDSKVAPDSPSKSFETFSFSKASKNDDDSMRKNKKKLRSINYRRRASKKGKPSKVDKKTSVKKEK